MAGVYYYSGERVIAFLNAELRGGHLAATRQLELIQPSACRRIRDLASGKQAYIGEATLDRALIALGLHLEWLGEPDAVAQYRPERRERDVVPHPGIPTA